MNGNFRVDSDGTHRAPHILPSQREPHFSWCSCVAVLSFQLDLISHPPENTRLEVARTPWHFQCSFILFCLWLPITLLTYKTQQWAAVHWGKKSRRLVSARTFEGAELEAQQKALSYSSLLLHKCLGSSLFPIDLVPLKSLQPGMVLNRGLTTCNI